ncbi:hypothetical protein INT43_003972 [Umbelopsis isabellina]|uniref:L-2-hydroxyglutarate dehydrogenase, mitochondrial n=1 Tax=Mortierella isabellina TaxID=91625 RepID=A0A8H7PU01_MORIS|nr:hypothetical protein INT43_003972 [Umbelopsis isabellina]
MQYALPLRSSARTALYRRVPTLLGQHTRLFSASATPHIHLWDHLPGEEIKEPREGLAKLKGKIREERFRRKPQINFAEHDRFDVVVVGGGIVGLATAREILNRYPDKTVAVLEKEREVARHQTGHNSGVIHAGMYYEPGSTMAYTCVKGAQMMYDFCEKHQLPVERCGKMIVAVNEAEHKEVEKLYHQGNANGVKGLEIYDSKKVSEVEPNVRAYSALYSPNTGIVDYGLVSETLAREIIDTGRADIKLAFEATRFDKLQDGSVEITGIEPAQKGPILSVNAKNVITCGGFYADRLAGLTGGNPHKDQVVTFRGTYYQLKPEYRTMVRMNIYPIPSGGGIPVGTHITPTLNSRRGHALIVGPGACFTFSREGYQFFDFKAKDVWDSFTNTSFWAFALKNLGLSFGELYKDINKRAFMRAAQAYLPDLTLDMVEHSFSGVMPQVFQKGGIAASDYILERKVLGGTTLNVRNAPSPACTASLAIGEMVTDTAAEDFGWPKIKR